MNEAHELDLLDQLEKKQEARTFFDKPVRWTTIMCHPRKRNYQEFIEYLRRMDVQDNLRSGERFIEEWFEFFLSYHEIECHYEDENKTKRTFIIAAAENEVKMKEFEKDLANRQKNDSSGV